MDIIDLDERYHDTYFCCLEDWSDEMKESGDKKKRWFDRHSEKGLRVKLAKDMEGRIGGMIQYLPIEQSFAAGKDLYFVLCIWVHGHKKGRGNFQRKGMGKKLLAAAERDVKALGGKGLAVWGLSLPFWMKASWYRKFGYKRADRTGAQVLLWKPFSDDAEPPSWIRKQKDPLLRENRVVVTAFNNGWCPAMNVVYERAKRAAAEIGDAVIFREIDTGNRKNLLEWGISDGLYINKRELKAGPPPSYDDIKKKIEKEVKKL
jgi:GNAT superfamily N-acetyltransferase